MTYREASPLGARVLVVALGRRVYGLDVDTGERRWTYEAYGANLRVVVDADRVFAVGGELVCLDQGTGRVLWQQAKLPVTSTNWSLLVDGSSIFLAGAGEVACFDAGSGALRWHDPFKGMGFAAIALAVHGKAVQADLDS